MVPGNQREEPSYRRIMYCCKENQTILEVAKTVVEKYKDKETIDEETLQKYARRIVHENFQGQASSYKFIKIL